MKNIDEKKIRERIETMLPTLNEYQRRRYLSAEARSIGHGGISLINRISGMSRQTLTLGIKELESPEREILKEGRSRRAGGGRKPIWESQPGILEAVKEIVDGHTKGDPMSGALQTNKSRRNVSKELSKQGFSASHQAVGSILKKLKYGLQADKKTLTTTPSHPDRDAQFEYIKAQVKEAEKKGIPVLSIDAKKKEKIGNFINGGRTYRKQKDPIKVLDHDFPIEELGKVTPYGIYDIGRNEGFVNLGVSSDTSEFAIESISRWWLTLGKNTYPETRRLYINCDGGGSNGSKNKLFKLQLQQFANLSGLEIHVSHFPPGTSKWNKIEHRMFCYITSHWKGQPLISVQTVIQLIGSTTTTTGLKIICMKDETVYKIGKKVSDEEFETIKIKYVNAMPAWNYIISPNV